MNDGIPLVWIRDYVDKMLTIAAAFQDGKMQDVVMLRADHVMDMVKAWKESKKGTHE